MFNKLYGGIVLTIRESGRAEAILSRIRRERRFTATVSSSDHRPKELDTYLISLSGKALEFICLGRVSRGGGVTGSRRVTLLGFVDLSALLLEQLEAL